MLKDKGNGITSRISHKAPYLFIDGVKDYNRGEGVECEMVLNGQEPYFSGHFPGRPILPGVFEVEAMFQAAEVFIALEWEEKERIYSPGDLKLLKIVSAKFQRPISPPGIFTVSVLMNKVDGEKMKFQGTICHGAEKCAESTFVVKVL